MYTYIIAVKVDFVDVANTEEYKQYLALTEIFLGDAVRVVAPRIGVSVSMRMTQYTYDCLTKKYTAMTLGTVSDTVESSLISIRQLAAGSITGVKLAIHSVGAGQLQAGAVGSLQIKNAAIGNAHIQNAAIGTAHIQNASIVQAHITDALIEMLNANAITAVTAKIEELVAGSITTDELYASIAAIALAQITTANIINANIDWAKIETLVAASAEIAQAEIGSASIGWAQIRDLITDTAIITEGVAGELYIARLAVTEANMVSLTVGELVVKGEDGCFYALSVDEKANMLWLDTSVSPNLLKRYTGSEWVIAGAEEVKSSGVYIGPNKVAITTENFLLQLLDPSNNENVLMEMSADGSVGFKELYADQVISDSVAAAYDGPDMLEIDPTFTGTSDSIFRSLGDAVKAVNNKFLPYNVYIFLPYGMGDIYESAGTCITGVTGPGKLSIFGGDGILHSYISVMGCSAHIYFYGLSMREIRSLNGGNRNPYLVELTMNRFVEFNSCTLDANNTTYDSVYCKSTHVALRNTSLYNALQGLEVYMGWGYVRDCNGSCSWSMVCYAGYIIAHGTVPGGSRGTGENGQLFDSGVTVDYGSATAPVTPETTGYFYASTTKTYRGGWRSDTLDVIQGVYSDSGYKSSLNWNYGCMWFSSLKSTLSGKTVKSATLTLHRETGSGASSAKTVYLCAISNTSASGAPSIVTNYGGIGKIGRNATVTFSIPTDAVQGLANGTYGGLCLYETKYNFGSSTYSSCYMRMSGTDTDSEPYLTVVYS